MSSYEANRIGSKRDLLEYFKSLGATDESLAIISRWDDSYESTVHALIHYRWLRELGRTTTEAEAELVRQFGLDPRTARTLASGKGYAKQRQEAARRRKLRAEAALSHDAVGIPTTG